MDSLKPFDGMARMLDQANKEQTAKYKRIFATLAIQLEPKCRSQPLNRMQEEVIV
jgi:hypothetical protein